jgi:hypothetical protein
MDPAGTGWAHSAPDFPRDITLLRGNSTIVYEDGTHAVIGNGLYNHHLVTISPGHKGVGAVGCGTKTRSIFADAGNYMGAIFLGGSEDRGDGHYTTERGTFKSGYYIGPNDKVVTSGDVVNYTNDTKTIYVIHDIEYIPGKPKDFLDASTQVLSVGMCDGKMGIFQPNSATKRFSLADEKGETVSRDGYVFNIRESQQ